MTDHIKPKDDASTYKKQTDKENILKLREILKELPEFCEQYFLAMESTTSSLTRVNYARDLKIFFFFLMNEIPKFKNYSMQDFKLNDLDEISVMNLEKYLSYLTLYHGTDDIERDNDQSGKERKLAALRSLYKYFVKRELIKTNPAALTDSPKKHEKAIIRLEPNEVVKLLDLAESGEKLTERQKKYHERTKTRDVALLTLLLGTGIRVSECVGLDIGDVNFEDYSFRVTRKGGDQVVLYFGDEVFDKLSAYYNERTKIKAFEGHENALFLSMQNKRLDVRSVQNLVKKYASVAAPLKKISPHKLRSTFGTELYRETGDIYLVADVLGHSDINITRRHYAAQSDDNRRQAMRVKLHEPD
ncbi:MAG: tyrosine-type recombinase/integrase [Clostridia bacterium]|nr:tyrosine-type recombinase/integrase [Clostridia bacterium]